MALSAAMVWEVQIGGSDASNSGGFRGGAYIAPPSAPTVTPSGSGGTVAAATYYVIVTYTDGLGETVISGQTAVITSGATASFTVTSPGASTGALTWSAYCGTTSGGPYFPQGTALVIGSNRVVTTTPPTTGTQPRGVDRSLSTTRFMVLDNSTITATTAGANSNVLTFTGYTPTGADVGNIFRATAGTNINAGFFEITAITATTWTVIGAANLTTASGAGSAIVGGMGGAFASLGQASATNAGTYIYIKGPGTFTIANGTANTAGNKYSGSWAVIGYSSNRHPGNSDTKPVLDAGAASMTMFTSTGNPNPNVESLSFTNSGSNASVTGFNAGTQQFIRNLSFSGLATPIASSGTLNHFEDIYLTGCGTLTPGNGSQFIRLVVNSPTATVFATPVGNYFREMVVISPPASASAVVVGTGFFDSCVIYSSSGSGVNGFDANVAGSQLRNCIVYGCSGTGFRSGNFLTSAMFNCAAGACGTNFDAQFTSYAKSGCITLTGDPFTNAAGGDYSLNNTAGGGAACRGAGIPGTFPGLSTTGYRDIGAAQTQAAAGGAMHLAGRGGGLAG